MPAEFKPNGLAFIKKDRVAENINKVVRLISFNMFDGTVENPTIAPNGRRFVNVANCWLCKSEGQPLGVLNTLGERVADSEYVYFIPTSLIPIEGLPGMDETLEWAGKPVDRNMP